MTRGVELIRLLTLLWLRLKRPFLLWQLDRARLRWVDGVPLTVLPGVHDPVVFRTGRFLARAIAELPPTHATADAPPHALDMGTGSGIAAIFAARQGYHVLGVDVSAAATRCARANVLINDLQEQVRILQGDLFAPVHGKQFDLVTFNPPFYRGQPRSEADVAWRSPDVIERFAAGLPLVLLPKGRALIVFSSDGDESGLIEALRQNGFTTMPVVRRNFHNEVVTVYAATRRTTSAEPSL
jgi:HemK-related putative methylase